MEASEFLLLFLHPVLRSRIVLIRIQIRILGLSFFDMDPDSDPHLAKLNIPYLLVGYHKMKFYFTNLKIYMKT